MISGINDDSHLVLSWLNWDWVEFHMNSWAVWEMTWRLALWSSASAKRPCPVVCSIFFHRIAGFHQRKKKKSFEMKSTDLNPCVVASTSRIANLEVHIQGRTRFDFPDLECEIPECSQASSRMGIWHNLLHHQDSETLDSINKISKKSNDLCWGLVEIPSIPVPVNPQTLQWKIPPFTDDVHWLPH